MPGFSSAPPLLVAHPHPTRAALAGALFALTKPRIGLASVITTMAAYAAAQPPANTALALATLAGTALAAGGALSFNQWWERRTDALMHRTRNRPLPRALLPAHAALAWGIALATSGVALLAACVNPAAAVIAASTAILYALVYTPLKRRTRWATEVGAISGALPALLGNAAAGDVWATPGIALAAVLLFWQMPHFFAIGWWYRADYRAAGSRLLPAIDPTGAKTGAWSLVYTVILMAVSLAPWALGWFGPIYGVSVTLAGAGFIGFAWRFASALNDRDPSARRLFVASIFYLPMVIGALLLDRYFAA